MVEALKWFSTVLADKEAPIMARRVALYYVAHLVGDMHQPLHASRAGDRGGVNIAVSYRGVTTNLHYFWDSNLVDLETGAEEAERQTTYRKPHRRRASQMAGRRSDTVDE